MINSQEKSLEERLSALDISRSELIEKKRKAGEMAYWKKAGIHKLSKKQYRINGKKAGKVSYEKRAGIHALTSEEKSEAGKKGGLNSILKRGMIPYTGIFRNTEFGFMEERDYIIILKISGMYDYYGGWKEITTRANDTYGNSRIYDIIKCRCNLWINKTQ